MKISVIIPVYKDPRIERCRRSMPKDVEVIMEWDVDHEGPATVRNRGARRAKGDVLFFIDSDAVVYPDTLQRIDNHMENPILDGLTCVWSPEPLEDNFFNKFKALEMNYTMTHYFRRACASNGTAIRTKVFWAVGGFNESFKEAVAEDFHFGLKVFKAGYNIGYDKTIMIQHSFCNGVWEGLKKYSRRAYHRAKLLVDNDMESSYNSKKLKLIYASTLLPPLFFLLNLGLYRTFLKYGIFFTIRATLLHYIYMLLVAISGGLGYGYAYLRKIFHK